MSSDGRSEIGAKNNKSLAQTGKKYGTCGSGTFDDGINISCAVFYFENLRIKLRKMCTNLFFGWIRWEKKKKEPIAEMRACCTGMTSKIGGKLVESEVSRTVSRSL